MGRWSRGWKELLTSPVRGLESYVTSATVQTEVPKSSCKYERTSSIGAHRPCARHPLWSPHGLDDVRRRAQKLPGSQPLDLHSVHSLWQASRRVSVQDGSLLAQRGVLAAKPLSARCRAIFRGNTRAYHGCTNSEVRPRMRPPEMVFTINDARAWTHTANGAKEVAHLSLLNFQRAQPPLHASPPSLYKDSGPLVFSYSPPHRTSRRAYALGGYVFPSILAKFFTPAIRQCRALTQLTCRPLLTPLPRPAHSIAITPHTIEVPSLMRPGRRSIDKRHGLN